MRAGGSPSKRVVNPSVANRSSMPTLNFVELVSDLFCRIRRSTRVLARLVPALLLAGPSAWAADVDVSKLPPATSRKVDFVKDIQDRKSTRLNSSHIPLSR